MTQVLWSSVRVPGATLSSRPWRTCAQGGSLGFLPAARPSAEQLHPRALTGHLKSECEVLVLCQERSAGGDPVSGPLCALKASTKVLTHLAAQSGVVYVKGGAWLCCIDEANQVLEVWPLQRERVLGELYHRAGHGGFQVQQQAVLYFGTA